MTNKIKFESSIEVRPCLDGEYEIVEKIIWFTTRETNELQRFVGSERECHLFFNDLKGFYKGTKEGYPQKKRAIGTVALRSSR